MSPWNIISKFRSKAPAQAAKPAHEPAIPRSVEASLSVASDELRTTQAAPAADAMVREHERVVLRVSAHHVSSENSTVTEQLTHTEIAEEPGDAHQVSEDALTISDARPTYDLRTKKKAAKASRVSLKSAGAKAPTKLVETPPSDERGEYVTAAFSLDDDIKQLRATLAEKLETQNDQLRNMLSRFDGR